MAFTLVSLNKMFVIRALSVLLVITYTVRSASAIFFKPASLESGIDGVKKAPRWNIPWLGVGLWCNGCPPRSCEDDEAIIHGYCCGCAHALDKLPVICPEFLQCPLNLHGLCHDYEYMMRCCC